MLLKGQHFSAISRIDNTVAPSPPPPRHFKLVWNRDAPTSKPRPGRPPGPARQQPTPTPKAAKHPTGSPGECSEEGGWSGTPPTPSGREESEVPIRHRRKAVRQFHQEWVSALPWLYLNTDGCMRCYKCENAGRDNSFTNGNPYMQRRAVTEHANLVHVHLGEMPWQVKECRPPPVADAYLRQLESEAQHIKNLLRNVYFLAKSKSPMRLFSSLCHLSELQGLPVNSSYRNSMAARDFALALANAILAQWLPHAQRAHALGLMIDESTTVSSDSALIVYLRFLLNGTVVTKFWKLVRVADGGAQTIFDALVDIFDLDDLDPARVASMGTDGATPMLGHKSGVATRLKAAWNPFLVIIHCICHREALAVSNAYKKSDTAEWFEARLRDILHFFKDSSARKSKLAELQKQFKVASLRMLKLHTVRWLSRGAVAGRIHHSFGPLVQEFREDADSYKRATESGSATSGAIWAFMVSHRFLFLLCCFADILDTMTLLNRCFQARRVSFHNVKTMLDGAKGSLRSCYTSTNIKGGTRVQALRAAMSPVPRNETDCAPSDGSGTTPPATQARYWHAGTAIQFSAEEERCVEQAAISARHHRRPHRIPCHTYVIHGEYLIREWYYLLILHAQEN